MTNRETLLVIITILRNMNLSTNQYYKVYAETLKLYNDLNEQEMQKGESRNANL